ncbi:MAG: hypothetical protein H6R10_3257 [Rhodocyclaceae bacterium]|nr:hypothetical protein [Rhodocyclaceae bacterium]
MRFLLMLSLVLCAWGARAERVRVLVQSSPLAGSQYYALAEVWPRIKTGDPLVLAREAGNRHDARAIRVEWRGRKLGYLPRAENRIVAAALDGGDRLSARVSRLTDDPNPWRRLEVEIYVDL